jgi:hypothetical protein
MEVEGGDGRERDIGGKGGCAGEELEGAGGNWAEGCGGRWWRRCLELEQAGRIRRPHNPPLLPPRPLPRPCSESLQSQALSLPPSPSLSLSPSLIPKPPHPPTVSLAPSLLPYEPLWRELAREQNRAGLGLIRAPARASSSPANETGTAGRGSDSTCTQARPFSFLLQQTCGPPLRSESGDRGVARSRPVGPRGHGDSGAAPCLGGCAAFNLKAATSPVAGAR